MCAAGCASNYRATAFFPLKTQIFTNGRWIGCKSCCQAVLRLGTRCVDLIQSLVPDKKQQLGRMPPSQFASSNERLDCPQGLKSSDGEFKTQECFWMTKKAWGGRGGGNPL